jgi:hypothetical protein
MLMLYSKKRLCSDCGVDLIKIGEYYIVKDKVWDEVASKNELLCIGCLEKRIGRKLISEDFPEIELNYGKNYSQSRRLLNRMGKE